MIVKRAVMLIAAFALLSITLSGCTYGEARWYDFTDIWRAHAGFATGFGTYAQITDEYSIGYNWHTRLLQSGIAPGHPVPGFFTARHQSNGTHQVGWPFGNEQGNVYLYGPIYSEEMYISHERITKHDEIKVSLHVSLVGGQVGFDPVELADFVVGLVDVDLVGDDYDGFPSKEFAELVQVLHEEHLLLKRVTSNNYKPDEKPSDALESMAKAHQRAFELAGTKSLVNQTDPHGRTALHWAAAYRHQESIDRLLTNGTVADSRDRYKCTPLDYAIKYCSIKRGAKPVADLLVKSGATLKCKPITLIFQSVLRRDLGLAEFAVSQGADLSKRQLYDLDKMTLNPSIIHRYIEQGMYPQLYHYKGKYPLLRPYHCNVMPWSSTTPLHFAMAGSSSGDFLPIIKYLLKSGVDPNFPNAEGQTPLQVASNWDRQEVADMLRKYGAKMPGTTPDK
jgi:ankyrin repeat protein